MHEIFTQAGLYSGQKIAVQLKIGSENRTPGDLV